MGQMEIQSLCSNRIMNCLLLLRCNFWFPATFESTPVSDAFYKLFLSLSLTLLSRLFPSSPNHILLKWKCSRRNRTVLSALRNVIICAVQQWYAAIKLFIHVQCEWHLLRDPTITREKMCAYKFIVRGTQYSEEVIEHLHILSVARGKGGRSL